MQLVQLLLHTCYLPGIITHWPSNSSLLMNRVILAQLQFYLVIDIYALFMYIFLFLYLHYTNKIELN
ncbi:hypothetical protein ANANG_G00226580 [Anguilla anguilla]|uniref:Uncharacterized protein n=1 Tax=Anguilla anguilla TaxID=7936 RepID=A0A9D3RQN7_ANGAN|nr:hypothetical protein ANANG_G00226580 [Anguilla anguilla]